MSERERPRVVQALSVPCGKGAGRTAIITVWSDGAKTCSNHEFKAELPDILILASRLDLCSICPARSEREFSLHRDRAS